MTPQAAPPFAPGVAVLVSPGPHTLWPDYPVLAVVAPDTPAWCDLVKVETADGTLAAVFSWQCVEIEP